MSALVFAGYSVAAAVGVALLVAFLYWLKPPARRVVVPSSVIWERILAQGSARTDRLRWWLSLLIALVIALTLVGSISVAVHRARPGDAGARLVLLIDDSATMATRTTDGGTRLDHGLRKAREIIAASGAGTQIWVADTMRNIATPSYRSRDEALSEIARLRVAPGRAMALPLPHREPGTPLVVITDGVTVGALPADASIESAFEPVENAGITGFEVRAVPADPRRYVAYVEISNAGGTDKRMDVTLTGVGGKRASLQLSVPRHGANRGIVDVSEFDAGPVRAAIAVPGDGLPLDDVAYAILPARKVQRVALVTTGNAFLGHALAALPRTKVSTISPTRYAGDADFDAVVLDRFAPAARPRVPALLFRPPPVAWLPPMRAEAENLVAANWDGAHPLLDNVSLRDLVVDRASAFDMTGRAMKRESVLASTAARLPLVVSSEEGAHWIALPFGIEDSNFALHAGFPLFLNNALDWMLGAQPPLSRATGWIEVPLADARVVAADGTEALVRPIPGGSLFEAAEPGIYTAVSSRGRMRITANLLDRGITDVNASPLAVFRPSLQPAPTGTALSWPDGANAFLVAAALLMLFEWWAWNRRLTV